MVGVLYHCSVRSTLPVEYSGKKFCKSVHICQSHGKTTGLLTHSVHTLSDQCHSGTHEGLHCDVRGGQCQCRVAVMMVLIRYWTDKLLYQPNGLQGHVMDWKARQTDAGNLSKRARLQR